MKKYNISFGFNLFVRKKEAFGKRFIIADLNPMIKFLYNPPRIVHETRADRPTPFFVPISVFIVYPSARFRALSKDY